MTEKIEFIELDRIIPSKGNRSVGGFDQAKLESLAESIQAVGVQQPAVVRIIDNGPEPTYEIVAGERRWRASRLAGMPTLPCVVRELTDDQLLKIQVIENLQREEMHPLDEADGYERLRVEGGYGPELIAHEVGKSISYVYQRLRLLKLCAEARELLMKGSISVAVAVLLARLEESQQSLVIKARIQDWNIKYGVTAADINDWISENLMLDLSKASWDMKDKTLVKKSVACSACSKRTGSNPNLFGDIENDACTDSSCYKEKQKAILDRNMKSLEGKDHLVVRRDYGQPNPAGSLAPYEWTECKEGDSGAVPAILVNGDSPGKLIYAIKKEAEEDPEEDDSENDARIKMNELRYQAKKNTNKIIFEEIISEARKLESDIGLLRYLAKKAFSDYGRYSAEIARWYGWAYSEDDATEFGIDDAVVKIEKMENRECVIFMMACLLSGSLEINQWSEPIRRELIPFVELLNIKAVEIQAQEYEKLGVPVLDPDDDDSDDDDSDESDEDSDEQEQEEETADIF